MVALSFDQDAVTSYCQEYNTATIERQAEIVSDLAQGVYNRSLRLQNVVMGLAPQLTSTDGRLRMRGLTLLSQLLIVIRTHKFAWSEVNVLVDFYLARMEDFECTTPCIKGISAVVHNQALTNEQAKRIIETLFAQVRVSNLAQPERSEFYSMMEHFLNNDLNVVKELGHEFVFGYVQAVDGEKDPRNLVQVFTLTKSVCELLDVSRFSADLFEVTICYFPVTFNPPADDPHAITRKDITDGLNNALAATPLFAEFGIPTLFEKLDSHVDETRIEAFRALSICAPAYSQAKNGGLMSHMQRFWEVVKKEMYEFDEKSTEGICLTATRRVFAAISNNCDSDAVRELTETVVEECLIQFKDQSDIMTLTPSSKILASITGASGLTCAVVARVFVPTVAEQYERPESYPQFKHALLEGLLNFVRAHNMLYFPTTAAKTSVNMTETVSDATNPEKESEMNTILLEHVNTISGLFYGSCCAEQPSLRALACYGIEGLVTSRQLNENELGHSTKELASMAMIEEDINVQMALVDVTATVARLAPSHMLTSTATPMLDALKTCDPDHTEYILRILEALASSEQVGISMAGHATAKLLSQDVIGQQFAKWAEALDRIVTSLCANDSADFVDSRQTTSHAPDYVVLDVVIPLVSRIIKLTEMTVVHDIHWNKALLQSVANVIVTATRQSSQTAQQQLMAHMTTTFGETDRLTNTTKPTHGYHLDMYKCAFVNMRVSNQPALTSPILMSLLTDVALKATTSAAYTMDTALLANKILASACNKEQDKIGLESFITTVCEKITSSVQTPIETEQAQLGVNTWSWLVKGLMLRSHKADPLVAGYGFGADTNSVDNVKRARYLTALSFLLQHAPRQVLTEQLPPLLPLLLASLSMESSELIQSTLKTFIGLMEDASSVIKIHVDSLLPLLLNLARTGTTMEVRKSSLECINAMSALPYQVLHPSRAIVLEKVGECLGDHKRLVRREAQVCRNTWFLL
eukprot:CFRG0200T1